MATSDTQIQISDVVGLATALAGAQEAAQQFSDLMTNTDAATLLAYGNQSQQARDEAVLYGNIAVTEAAYIENLHKDISNKYTEITADASQVAASVNTVTTASAAAVEAKNTVLTTAATIQADANYIAAKKSDVTEVLEKADAVSAAKTATEGYKDAAAASATSASASATAAATSATAAATDAATVAQTKQYVQDQVSLFETANDLKEDAEEAAEAAEAAQAAMEARLAVPGALCDQISWLTTEAIAADSLITFPGTFKYLVMNNHLHVFVNGSNLGSLGFEEVGSANTASNQIRTLIDIPAESTIHAYTHQIQGDVTSTLSSLPAQITNLTSRVETVEAIHNAGLLTYITIDNVKCPVYCVLQDDD